MLASLQGSMSTRTKKNESNTGHVLAAGFHHVTARSRLACFETYEPFISVTFHIVLGRGKPWIIENIDIESTDTGVCLYSEYNKLPTHMLISCYTVIFCDHIENMRNSL
jgi:hypothetical protein